MVSISSAERLYIAEGIAQNIRNDGRSRMDYRHFGITLGVIPHANGSARLLLDTTDILVGVNLEIGEPDSARPKEGMIYCSVECTASASSDFEGKGGMDLNVVLSGQLRNLILHSHAIDLTTLCIIPGQTCWVLYVDALVLNSAGSLLDAIALCTKAALSNTLVPKTTVVEGKVDGTKDFEVNDDIYETIPFNHENVGLAVSLTKVGNWFIVDASEEEESCMATRITVCIDKTGNICGMSKAGPGAVAPAALGEMLHSAVAIGKDLHERLEAALEACAST